jgi:hypothetical protein
MSLEKEVKKIVNDRTKKRKESIARLEEDLFDAEKLKNKREIDSIKRLIKAIKNKKA